MLLIRREKAQSLALPFQKAVQKCVRHTVNIVKINHEELVVEAWELALVQHMVTWGITSPDGLLALSGPIKAFC